MDSLAVVSSRSRAVRDAVLDTLGGSTLPGVQVAWLVDGVVEQVDIGARVAAETRFALGSVTKAFTASAAMQLVGDGTLDLDAPVADWLPAGGAREALDAVTLRQLLSHTAGLENDHADAGPDVASIRDYVRACDGELLFRPGELFSYANAGYVVVGHLIEACTDLSWADAVQTFLLDPMDVRGTFFLSDPVAPGLMADGHVRRHDGRVAAVGTRTLGRAWAPAGGLALNAASLLRLAQLHLGGGRTELGIELLPQSLVAEMRRPHVTVPDRSFGEEWGLGWALFQDGAWFGHDGNTEGFCAYLRASAEAGVAIAMLTNCLPADEEWRLLLRGLDWLGVPPEAAPPEPDPAVPVDPSAAGAYENGSARWSVALRDGALSMALGDETATLRPAGADRYVATPDGGAPYVVVFIRDRDGAVGHLHCGGRVARRVAS